MMLPLAVVGAGWRLWAALLLAGAVAGGAAAWWVQAARLDGQRLQAQHHVAQVKTEMQAALHQAALEAQRQQTALEAAHVQALQAARAQEQDFQRQMNRAHHEHHQTLERMRSDDRTARTELERLRDALATPYGLPGSASATSAIDPDPARDLLGQCAAAYIELAQQADGHAADAQLLLHGWPR